MSNVFLRSPSLVFLVSLTTLLISGCTTTNSGRGADASSRPETDSARDAGRKPFEVVEVLGIKPGMKVIDIIAAGGYYTEVLAQTVGSDGLVYAQNPAVVLRFNNGGNNRAMNARLAHGRLPNVRRLDRELDDLGLVANSLDGAITALNFHDVYNRDKELAASMLLTVKGLLKPGGVLGLIDHDSNPGSDHAKLHRMPVADAIAAAEAAGFEVTSSDLLRNPADNRTQGPFVPELRGNTDRFLLKLTKPGE